MLTVPTSALLTPCLSHCDSRVQWEYDEGEPMTRWYPGVPETFIPVSGCSEDHLEILSAYDWQNLYAGMLYRQLDQWLMLSHAAWKLGASSQRFLLGQIAADEPPAFWKPSTDELPF